MDDATLARLEHVNMLDWLRIAFAQVPGAIVRFEDGVAVAATGLPAPFFNQIVTDDGASPEAVAGSVALLRERGARFCVVLRRDQDAHLRALMAELGLALDEHVMPGMALDPIPPDLPTDAPGLELRLVRHADSLRDHALVAAHSYGFPEAVALAFIGDELWTREGATVYTGYADGRPVTSGFSIRSGDTLGIFTIATEADARGRGFGAAMTGRLIADGAAAGCTVSALQASSMGRPIYERLGFRLVQEYEIYVEPRS
jgi:GNAT superfamily N-acetyltransferase